MTTTDGSESFVVVPGDPGSSVIVHVPHSATAIPLWVRARITLSDADLADELQLMTDARTEDVARAASSSSSNRPWLFINQLSRLVIDPERFPDPEHEPMAAPEIGMGPVYTRTSHGRPLRDHDPHHEQSLMDTYFHPYASALSSLVDERRGMLGSVTIIDLHSFPRDELPYERLHHADAARPALCIGADEFHTPTDLVEAAGRAFAPLGDMQVNAPFAGSYVPLNRYESDTNLQSVMIEMRRDTYLGSEESLLRAASMLSALIDACDAG